MVLDHKIYTFNIVLLNNEEDIGYISSRAILLLRSCLTEETDPLLAARIRAVLPLLSADSMLAPSSRCACSYFPIYISRPGAISMNQFPKQNNND